MARLEERMRRMSAATRERLPAEALEVVQQAAKRLRASGLAARAIGVGDRAPHFELSDGEGTPHRLADEVARGPVLLSFYRGRW